MGRGRKPNGVVPGALVAIAVGVGALSPVAPVVRAQDVDDPRPNILVIVTDDQRAGTLSVMPATKRLFQKEGRRFPRAFATTPLCCPSRGSIFTGLYAHNHGVLRNGEGDLLIQEDTMQRYLQDAGYNTAIVGKFINGWRISDNPSFFDRWSIFGGGYYSTTWNVYPGLTTPVEDYSTTFVKNQAMSYLGEFSTQPDPWFLYVAPSAPHWPFTPEPKYEDASVPDLEVNPAMRERDRRDKPLWVRRLSFPIQRSVRRQQLRTLMSVDDMVGEIFAQLEQLGEADNTLAFFLSDNGFLWGEHGVTAKRYPYTDSAKIPLLMRWPGIVEGGTRDRRFVGNIDLAPTVLAAAGVEAPQMDGRVLLDEDHSRTRMLLEFSRDIHWRRIPSWASIRTRRYQFIEYYRLDGSIRFREFYRLRKDPWQLTNVLRDGNRKNDPDVRKLHRLLKNDRRCSGSTCP